MTEGEDEELLKHLFQIVSDTTPPPTNPPSPPAPEDMEADLDACGSSFVINSLNGIKSEINSSGSSPRSSDGDYSDDNECSSQVDESFSSDSGIEDGKNSGNLSPLYEGGSIEDDIINSNVLFGDNPFDCLLDTTKLSSLFEEDARNSDLELKHDCMWNGICCPSKTGKALELSLSTSPKLEAIDEFMRTKIKIEPESVEINVKSEPVQGDLGEEDAVSENVEVIRKTPMASYNFLLLSGIEGQGDIRQRVFPRFVC